MVDLMAFVFPSLPREGKVFPLNLVRYERMFAEALFTLGCLKHNLTPHIMRHSGPSNDRYDQLRSLGGIQKRGFWKAKTSVVRYGKHAGVLRQLSRLSTNQQPEANEASKLLLILWVH